MKKMLFFVLSLFAANAFAQKLPDIQAISLNAPAGIRIDGRPTEWNDTYAAENKRIEAFYTLANDNNNLYLILKPANSAVAGKILAGGITFTINTAGKKREKDAFSVTYPVITRSRNLNARSGGGQRSGGGFSGGRNQQTQQQRDSASLVQRKAALATAREIKVSGFKEITDSLVSIYNEYGLKTAANFDSKGDLIYELAIPLQLLGLTAGDGKELMYQIRLNGLNMESYGGISMGSGGGGRAMSMRTNGSGQNFQDMMSPTDFWGKYILYKP